MNVLLTSLMLLFIFVNIRSLKNVPHGRRVTNRAASDNPRLQRPEEPFNLSSALPGTEFFIHCLENLLLIATPMHLSSFLLLQHQDYITTKDWYVEKSIFFKKKKLLVR